MKDCVELGEFTWARERGLVSSRCKALTEASKDCSIPGSN
jgi:hypothetical protein